MAKATKKTDKRDKPDLEAIEIVGARTHNLKNVSCRIRRGKLTVVTGVSGSGKSSLAFDTLYAEGQRRYVASMSTYARQFLEKIQRADVEEIHNIPPAIALEQKNTVTNARSTIGTATEVRDFLRLLFARVGRLTCPDCELEVSTDSPQSAAKTFEGLPDGSRLIVVAPVLTENLEPLALKAVLDDMRQQGFTRALSVEGELVDLEDYLPEHLIPAKIQKPEKTTRKRGRKKTAVKKARKTRKTVKEEVEGQAGWIHLVTDRIALSDKSRSRLAEALELAFRAGGGRARVRDVESGKEWAFSTGLVCNGCGRSFRTPEPALFSFASPLGACPTCQGFGRVTGIDMNKVIPNWDLTLMDDPIVPWNSAGNREMYDFMKVSAPDIPWHTPLSEFTTAQRKSLLDGHKGSKRKRDAWCGVLGFFRWLEGRRYKIQARVMLARYRAYTTCPDCEGARLVPDALNIRVDGRTIAEIDRFSIEDLHEYFDLLRLPPRDEQAAERLLLEIRSRLHYLDGVGLGYLTLNRQTRSLSGGESQRINLATALGSALTETLYVLDEPTVGLHSRDTFRLLSILQALRESGNTVVVVEHDPDIILGADDIIDIGPRAGEHGGELLFEGPLRELARSKNSVTARFLAETSGIPLPSRGRSPSGWVRVRGARANNLQNLDVRFPRGVFACVTGVSGSGKSTLVNSVLYAGFKRMRDNAPIDVGEFDRLEGVEALADMILVDQRPPGRSTRSNPVTYVKAYDAIRTLFAETREARHAGVKAGYFSFNVAGGRCETCMGAGIVTIDMHFLADVESVCESCDGKRFQRKVLDITWEGKNIDDVLDMTVAEAMAHFAGEAKVLRGLEPLDLVGLGYLRLGQSTSTLSGGEAQRLKLAGFLAANKKVLDRLPRRANDGTETFVRGSSLAPQAGENESFMIFDEPTTGLHPLDLERLVALFHDLVDAGASILVIEHNLDLIAHADWIIDLGPEGGDGGGQVVAQGPPQKIMAAKDSHTGLFLKKRYRL